MQSRIDGIVLTFLLALTATAAAGEMNAPQRAPVPDATALDASQRAARDLFGDRFRSAKTPASKTAVAKEMVDAALKVKDGSADQFALLKIGREIAAGAGDAATALQSLEKQAERFDMPVAKLRAETLLTAAREATAALQHKAVAEAALPVMDDLAGAAEIALALEVCEAGRSAAQKSRQFALVNELRARIDELKKHKVRPRNIATRWP